MREGMGETKLIAEDFLQRGYSDEHLYKLYCSITLFLV